MRLSNFSVKNFRSIHESSAISLEDITVLVGKNNEGKSNLLKALNLAMQIISEHSKRRPDLRIRWLLLRGFDWNRDFPIDAPKNKKREIVFRLDFQLTTEEISDFQNETGSKINGQIPIVIKITENNNLNKENYSRTEINVLKQGRGSEIYKKNANKITNYIANKIDFNYIPAIRTSDGTRRVIDKLISRELISITENEDYKNAIRVIHDLEKKSIPSIEKHLLKSLNEFLPSVRKVQVTLESERYQFQYDRRFSLKIDDGVLTNIEDKGDGVKSLAALGLLKNLGRGRGISIIAMEEPESHLHPAAIHQLFDILQSLKEENQIVLTTHNPLLVNRGSISSNIIVDKGKAREAESIESIREILGVKVSDNLKNIRFAIVVEGENDKSALWVIMSHYSHKIKTALIKGDIAILPLHGKGNLINFVSKLKADIIDYHILLDSDDMEKDINSIRWLPDGKEIERQKLTFIKCQGMIESEFEDCIDSKIYARDIQDEFGVNISGSAFKTKEKWSKRIKKCFDAYGKVCDDKTLMDLKLIVKDRILDDPSKALCSYKGKVIHNLIEVIEQRALSDN